MEAATENDDVLAASLMAGQLDGGLACLGAGHCSRTTNESHATAAIVGCADTAGGTSSHHHVDLYDCEALSEHTVEEKAIQLRRRDLVQALDEPHDRPRDGAVLLQVDTLSGLLLNSSHNAGMAVASVCNADARLQIQVLLAVDAGDPASLRSVNDDVVALRGAWYCRAEVLRQNLEVICWRLGHSGDAAHGCRCRKRGAASAMQRSKAEHDAQNRSKT